jgi:hypothetical protein
MQMVRNQQPTREGVGAFYRNVEKLAIEAVRVDRSDLSTIPVKLV